MFFLLQLFREELERVVGDSMRESGTEGISALLSDVMNIKNGSKSFLQKTTLRRSLIESWGGWGLWRSRREGYFHPFLFFCAMFTPCQGVWEE